MQINFFLLWIIFVLCATYWGFGRYLALATATKHRFLMTWFWPGFAIAAGIWTFGYEMVGVLYDREGP